MEILIHQMTWSDFLVHLLGWWYQFQCLLFHLLSQVSKSFMNPSTNSSTHSRFWWLDKTCLVEAMWRSSSIQAYKSSSPCRPLQIDLEVEGDELSNAFNLLSCSSILRVVGWDLEGRLIDRKWEDKREETASVGFNECNLEAGKWPAGVSFSCSKNRER